MVTLGVSVLVLQTAVFVGIAVSMFWYERSLGRRRFAVTMLAAMSLSIAIELVVGPFTGLDPGFQVIGFIIPGLIANEVLRQRVVPTLSTLGIVSAITAGVTILLVGFW